MTRLGTPPPRGVEMTLAFLVGAAWFATTTVLLAKPLPESLAVSLAMIAFDVGLVVVVARVWDIAYAVTIGVASVVALDWYFIPPTHDVELPDARNMLALVSYLLMASLLGELAVRARRLAVRAEVARSALADEQAALRRVATLVARQTAPDEVFAVVTEEVGRHLRADLATMVRYHTDGTATVVAAWSTSGARATPGTRLSLEGDNVAEMVHRTRRPARMDSFEHARGPWAASLRELGVRSSAGSPITVDGTVWGVMVVSSRSDLPVPEGIETRLGEFTELVATAVANAQARTDLISSRSRLVRAADESRRRIERDLHDGVQQRLVGLALNVRLTREMARDGTDITPQLTEVETSLVSAVDELRELSHGIHPAILTEGGLRPALGVLGRRSGVPVELDIGAVGRLAAPVEVGVYYVTSEALTNIAKHAGASVVRVALEVTETDVRLTVADDGVGGADRDRGSGLTGLEDRVHALGGRLEVSSPPGVGTTIVAVLPLPRDESPGIGDQETDGVA
ncbi:histidine kinase [Nocardioides conyzicola]|uniref:histidine kinase n=1 Tax=Nocardioides conyzicola TaxID=1651781 RepID=A0ABP8WZW4_9ACTN